MAIRGARRTAGMVALCLGLAGVAGCSGGAAPAGAAGAGASASAGSGAGILGVGRDADVMFAQMIVAHHTQGIAMADLALAGRGESSAVRDLAATIKAHEEPVLAQARQWLADWKEAPLAANHPGHKEPGMMSAPALAQLGQTSGRDFDLMWARMMQGHGEGAITLAGYLQRTSTTPEVTALAATVAETKRAEVLALKAIR